MSIVERAAALSLMCRLDSASVLIGQTRVILNPASISAVMSASQADRSLCVNITVIMPPSAAGFMTRRHSSNISRILAR